MKMRTLSLGSAALLMVTLLSTGIVSATPPAGHSNRSQGVSQASAKVATFRAKVTPGHPGGTIKVQAKVLHPVRGTTFTASAVATFTSGPVTVQLRRAGKSFVAVGKIPVPAGQTADVPVVVTIVYGGAPSVINKIATIKAP